MDKPLSLSVKDYLIRKLSVKMMIPEKTIDAVVSHQFSSANEALATNKSVEIAGFGKFYFNDGKAKKKLDKMLYQKEFFERSLLEEDITPKRRQNLQTKLVNIQLAIDVLKPRVI
jgi:hypothetical protein